MLVFQEIYTPVCKKKTAPCLPFHVALHPHLVREIPHQHPHHPKTSNSPTNPEQSIARLRYVMLGGMEPDSPVLWMFGHLENVESNIDKSNVSSQLQKVHNLHVLVQTLKPRGCVENTKQTSKSQDLNVKGYLFPLMLSWRTMLG